MEKICKWKGGWWVETRFRCNNGKSFSDRRHQGSNLIVVSRVSERERERAREVVCDARARSAGLNFSRSFSLVYSTPIGVPKIDPPHGGGHA